MYSKLIINSKSSLKLGTFRLELSNLLVPLTKIMNVLIYNLHLNILRNYSQKLAMTILKKLRVGMEKIFATPILRSSKKIQKRIKNFLYYSFFSIKIYQ